jgi:aminoglycoside phosphotransferase (APT) family kinase protein
VKDSPFEKDAEKLGERLYAFLAAQMPEASALSIEGLRRTSVGRSRENWIFDARWHEADGDRREALIMRRDPAGSVLETDRRLEFLLLQALERTALPAPRARWLDATGAAFGRPSIIMRREPGICDLFVLNGDRPLEQRLRLAREFCDLLAAVHQVDWRAVGLDEMFPDPGTRAAEVAVDDWERQLRRCQLQPHPELEVIASWLRAHAPAAQATVLVHADFKPGNALLCGDHIEVLLDWELAHLGDPMEDLGWITNPLRAREHQIAGVWEREQILAHYAERTGFHVDPQAVRWWNVLANYKLSVIALTGLAAFMAGRLLDRAYHIPTPLFEIMFEAIGA